MFIDKLKTIRMLIVSFAILFATDIGLACHVAAAAPMGDPDGNGKSTAKSDSSEDSDALPTGALSRFGTKRLQHGGTTSLSFSADGKTLFTQHGDNTVRSWEAATGKETRKWDGAAQLFSVDGKMLALGYEESRQVMRIWEVESGKEVCTWPHDKKLVNYSLVVSPDGRLVAIGYANSQRFEAAAFAIRDTASGKLNRTIDTSGMFATGCAACFSPDGKLFVTTGNGLVRTTDHLTYSVHLQDLSTGNEIGSDVPRGGKDDEGEHVVSVCISPDNHVLAMGIRNGAIRTWDLVSDKEIARWEGNGGAISSLTFSPDGKILAFGNHDGTIELHEAIGGKQLAKFTGHKARISALRFSPDGKVLASGSGDTAAFTWKVPEIVKPAAKEFSAEGLQQRWSDLGGDDAGKAYQAIADLAATPAQALPLMRKHLVPTALTEEQRKQVARLISDLDSDRFNTRDQASRDLEGFGAAVVPELRAALENKPTEEVRRRAMQLVDKLTVSEKKPSVAHIRAVQILELIGTSEAQAVLKEIAGRTPEARMTLEAQAALKRLAR